MLIGEVSRNTMWNLRTLARKAARHPALMVALAFVLTKAWTTTTAAEPVEVRTSVSAPVTWHIENDRHSHGSSCAPHSEDGEHRAVLSQTRLILLIDIEEN